MAMPRFMTKNPNLPAGAVSLEGASSESPHIFFMFEVEKIMKQHLKSVFLYRGPDIFEPGVVLQI